MLITSEGRMPKKVSPSADPREAKADDGGNKQEFLPLMDTSEGRKPTTLRRHVCGPYRALCFYCIIVFAISHILVEVLTAHSKENPLSLIAVELKSQRSTTLTSVPSTQITKARPFMNGWNNWTFQNAVQTISADVQVKTPKKRSTIYLCIDMQNTTRKPTDPVVLYDLSEKSCLALWKGFGGTGNIITDMFAKRFMALAGEKTAVLLDCGEGAMSVKHELVYPWVFGYFPPGDSLLWPKDMLRPTGYCSPQNQTHPARYNNMPLKFMIPLVRYDLRRMAVALVGVPNHDHPSAQFEKDFLIPEAQRPPFSPTAVTGTIHRIPIHGLYENGPLFPNVELDDVVIHFRCGDVLLGADGPFFYVPYHEYTNIISSKATTIGIVTQPFSHENGTQAREMDKLDQSGDRCRVLVHGLVEHIQSHLPKAKIRIHNGPHETVALAFARLIMANQTLALFPSTFSIFPTIASFGTGYFPRPHKHDRRGTAALWLTNDMTDGLYEDALVLLDFDKQLQSQVLANMWSNGSDKVLEWFRNGTNT